MTHRTSRASPIRSSINLIDELTFTGDLNDVDTLIHRFWRFKEAGINEMGLRLYDDPADSIRLIGETIGPELR